MLGGFPAVTGAASKLFAGEQSNTSFSVGNTLAVKLYRRLEPGVHPEPEMLRFLRERTDCRSVPAFVSTLEWIPGDGGPALTVALAQEFVAGAAAWDFALERLGKVLRSPGTDIPGELTAWATQLGACVGELHTALASRPDDPAESNFAPQPLTAADLDAARAGNTRRMEAGAEALGEATHARLRERNLHAAPVGSKIRTHGDLHLGQILTTGGDARILDFEGEPGHALAEARTKQSPWRDVAGMLRSFEYAAHVGARGAAHVADPAADGAEEGADRAHRLSAAFLSGYRGIPGGMQSGDPPRPATGLNEEGLLPLFMLEKAAYELEYECNNRPAWAHIPLRGLVTFCNDIGKNE
jgi:maltose alpha-D-glucosyltransferase/alpha-amylase